RSDDFVEKELFRQIGVVHTSHHRTPRPRILAGPRNVSLAHGTLRRLSAEYGIASTPRWVSRRQLD
ncbi:MAG: hypothetical protein ACTMH8_09175, partial [Brevibacterium aurantiacum]